MTDLDLTVTRTIAASRNRVFDAWLSPVTLAKFMRTPSGGEDARVTNDPVNGGRFSIVMATEEREIPHSGTYLAIDPHKHLSFTWESPFSLPESVVTIDFAEAGPEKTEITIRQVKFKNESTRDGHVGGWNAILDIFASQLV